MSQSLCVGAMVPHPDSGRIVVIDEYDPATNHATWIYVDTLTKEEGEAWTIEDEDY